VPGPSVNEHHLVPKSRRGRDTVRLHRICHNAIHAALSEKELAAHYNTIKRLRAHPAIARFIAWVANRPPEFYAPTEGARDGRSRKR
jgi:hypothetical protein